ncbi:MAG TPA: hypothetical protein VFO37_02520, partial [Chitinophagaceae bacterium]|nr:hypothetical protein [Chitinophagaceae bacterium]
NPWIDWVVLLSSANMAPKVRSKGLPAGKFATMKNDIDGLVLTDRSCIVFRIKCDSVLSQDRPGQGKKGY